MGSSDFSELVQSEAEGLSLTSSFNQQFSWTTRGVAPAAARNFFFFILSLRSRDM